MGVVLRVEDVETGAQHALKMHQEAPASRLKREKQHDVWVSAEIARQR
jgi:hypothetical protein